MKVADLKKRHEEREQRHARGRKMLASSLKNYGAGRSILIDLQGRIIAGNKTVEQAQAAGVDDVIVVKSDGKKLVAVHRTDLDVNDKKARSLAIVDNRAGELDLASDQEVLGQLSQEGVDLSEFFESDVILNQCRWLDIVLRVGGVKTSFLVSFPNFGRGFDSHRPLP